MADNLENRGPQDRSKISLTEEWEVAYRTKALGVTKEQLESAIRSVGNGVEVVKKSLGI